LQPNESIAGIDFRPATGQLYALGSTSRLYTLNTATGAATQVGGPGPFAPALNGFNFSFDFNPVIDRIRVVSETNKNYVLNPISATVQTVAPDVFYAAGDANVGVDPNVVDSAYTNNFAGAGTTTLYGIDTGLDILVTQVAATGALNTVGSLAAFGNVTAVGGFDISGVTGNAYAALMLSGESKSRFTTINLATGTPIGGTEIDGGLIITAMTVAPAIPEPSTVALAASTLLGGLFLRRRRD
jgi:hypothetical protein